METDPASSGVPNVDVCQTLCDLSDQCQSWMFNKDVSIMITYMHFIISMYIAKQSENSIYRLPETIFPEKQTQNQLILHLFFRKYCFRIGQLFS